MKLNRVTIKNFRGFAKPTSFEFVDHFNVLIGDNGAGKTAILDALAIGLSALLHGLSGHNSRRIQRDEIHRVRYIHGDTATHELQYPVEIIYDGIVADQHTVWHRVLTENAQTRTQFKSRTGNIVEISRNLQKAVQGGQSVILPLIAYYGTGRLWQQKVKVKEVSEPGSRIDAYANCLEPSSHERALFEWFQREEFIALQEGYPSQVLEGVRQALSNCLKSCRHVAYNARESDLLATFDDGRVLPFRMLSDGYRNLLGMIADIAYRAAVLNPQLGNTAVAETPGVILIDEIDLHLHPNWQRSVIGDLRDTFPNIQFIATTHSPFIIQSLRPGELINLDGAKSAPYADKSIEDIAEQVMEVDTPQRSERYLQMMEAAKEYYQVLQEAKHADSGRIAALKARLDELTAPFSDNIAYHAFLEMERVAAGLGNDIPQDDPHRNWDIEL